MHRHRCSFVTLAHPMMAALGSQNHPPVGFQFFDDLFSIHNYNDVSLLI